MDYTTFIQESINDVLSPLSSDSTEFPIIINPEPKTDQHIQITTTHTPARISIPDVNSVLHSLEIEQIVPDPIGLTAAESFEYAKSCKLIKMCHNCGNSSLKLFFVILYNRFSENSFMASLFTRSCPIMQRMRTLVTFIIITTINIF